MRYLAVLLLAPWLLILGWAYLSFPRELPRTVARRLFDAGVLIVAVTVTGVAVWHGFESVVVPRASAYGQASGGIWKQVLPALCGYGAWVATLLLALLVRRRFWPAAAVTRTGRLPRRPR